MSLRLPCDDALEPCDMILEAALLQGVAEHNAATLFVAENTCSHSLSSNVECLAIGGHVASSDRGEATAATCCHRAPYSHNAFGVKNVITLDPEDRSKRTSSCTSSTSTLLTIYTIGFLMSSCGNAIFFKKMTSAMPNYGWFLTQFTCFAYLPIFGSLLLGSKMKRAPSNEPSDLPSYTFPVMGFLDGLLCLMSVIGGAFTSGPAQLVLAQAAIPMTLVISSLALHQRFATLQYVGAAIIILGVIISKLPLLWTSTNDAHTSHDVPVFNIIFLAAALPGAISQVYKESVFQNHHISVNYMQFWVSVYQLLVGVVLAPLNALPLLGPQQIPLSNMLRMLTGGIRCLLLGQNTITQNCGSDPRLPVCDACSGAWIPVAVYLSFNVAYNIFILLIVKHGGAALSFIVATLRLPLATLLFYMHCIMGQDAVEPHLCDFEGVLLLLVGLLLYRHGGNAKKATPVPCLEKAPSLDASLNNEEDVYTHMTP